ncbi:MAG: hypothetical protein H7Z10_03705 [Gemmatimonadaceae bacterium]|nr:hypothetical protein [Acetobacteraceae bacterium]
MPIHTLLLAAVVCVGPIVAASAARAEGNNLAAVEVPAGTGIYETIRYGSTPGNQAAAPMDRTTGTSVMAGTTETAPQPRR